MVDVSVWRTRRTRNAASTCAAVAVVAVAANTSVGGGHHCCCGCGYCSWSQKSSNAMNKE